MENTARLETRMVKYEDLLTVKVGDCFEPLVPITSLPNGYLPGMSDMKRITGKAIMVRKSVNDRLISAQRTLKKWNDYYSLFVTYGYRTIGIQTKRFLKRLKSVSSRFYPSPISLYEEVHRSVAVPTVAGHPTGGAVDICIMDTRANRFLDFGSEMYNYETKKYYVFSPDISSEQKYKRGLLRSVMMKAGFAPFDGEWWHFSYGDKEWAFYYKKDYARYPTFR